MALFRRFFYRKPPDRLLEISDRIYLFDCCFSTDVLDEDEFRVYMNGIVAELQDQYPDAAFMVFNFKEGKNKSQLFDVLSQYGMTVMDYPWQYEGCPLLPLEMIHHFLRSSESWLSLVGQQNILLLHCERGGCPFSHLCLLAFFYTESSILANKRLLKWCTSKRQGNCFISCVLRIRSRLSSDILQYICRRNSSWIGHRQIQPWFWIDMILRNVPLYGGGRGCRPVVRVYGQDSSSKLSSGSSKLFFSTSKVKKHIRLYQEEECALVKLDIRCRVQGDIVLECVHLEDDLVTEEIIFRVMFHTAFVRSNVLMLTRDEIDVLWHTNDQFPREFRAEVLFSDADSLPFIITTEATNEDDNETESASPEEFFEAEEIFSNVIDERDGKVESDKHTVLASSVAEDNHSFVFTKENANHHAFQDCAPDEISQKHDEREKLNVDSVHNGDAQLDVSFVASDVASNSETKSVDTKNEPNVEPSVTKKIEKKGPHQKFAADIIRPKLDKGISTVSKKQLVSGSKSGSDAVGTDKKSKQQESQVARKAKPSAVSRWIPSNKGSYTNSMHVYYPPSSYNKALAELALRKKPRIPPKSKPQSVTLSSEVTVDKTLSGQGKHGPSQSSLPLSPEHEGSSLTFTTEPEVEMEAQENSPAPPLPPPPPPPPPITITHDTELNLSPPQPSSIPPPPPPPPPLLFSSVSIVASLHSGSPPQPPTPPPPPPLPMPSSRTENLSNSLQSPRFGTIAQDTFHPPLSPPTPPPTLPNVQNTDTVVPPPPPPPPPPWSMSEPSILFSYHPPSPELTPASSSVQICDSTDIVSSSPPPPSQLAMQGPPPPPPPPPPHPLLPFGVPSFPSHNSSPLPSGDGDLLPTPITPPSFVPPPSPPQPPQLSGVTPPPPPPPPALPGEPSVPPPHLFVAPPAPPPPIREMLPPQPVSHNSPPPPPPPPVRGDSSPPPPPPTIGVPALPTSLVRGPPPPPPPVGGHVPGPPAPPGPPRLPGGGGAPPPPPFGIKVPSSMGHGLSRSPAVASRRSNLKPLHWSKVTRAMQGSLWEELLRHGEPQVAPEFDVSEIETLFSATVPKAAVTKTGGRQKSADSKPDKVHLVDLRRANNTEIMLTKVKMPLPDMMAAALSMDESVLDADQVENLIKFCPTKEEMDLLKGYTGDKDNLGKCEQFFLELMKVPRVESKLRVFLFKIQFNSQVTDFKKSLNTVIAACEEVRNSVKLKEILKKILYLGNILNQGTARGSAVGFKLDSLLKLTDTRSSTSKMTLMHYLCKALASNAPNLLDFYEDLVNVELASKIQLKFLAEEMQAIAKGLEKVKQELDASENDGPVSETFRKTLKDFVVTAETEVSSVTNLYSIAGKNADALSVYFGEDPTKYPFEQVTATLLNFVRMFRKAIEENAKQAELEKKKAQKEAETESPKTDKKNIND